MFLEFIILMNSSLKEIHNNEKKNIVKHPKKRFIICIKLKIKGCHS